MNVDGSGQTLINNTGLHQIRPRFGRDAFIYLDQSGVGNAFSQQLYRIPQAGLNNATPLTNYFSQEVGPGGPNNRTAFLYNQPAPMLRIMNADGSNQVDVPNSPAGIFGRISYNSNVETVYFPFQDQIWKINTDGTSLTQLATGIYTGDGVAYGTAPGGWPIPGVTGAIHVTTNLSNATFTISGPATFTGSGTSFQTNAPAGTYTITYNQVAGYATPPQQTQTLTVGGTVNFVATYQHLGPRTFLITFTGRQSTAPGCQLPSGNTANCFPAGHLEDGQGMTTLLKNIDGLPPVSSTVIRQAFAFYSGTNGAATQEPTNNAALNPSTDIVHLEAANWLTSQQFSGIDRLVVAGHSWGGHRAKLFAEQVKQDLGFTTDALILVDPIDWTSCPESAYAVVSSSCNQRLLPPMSIAAGAVTQGRIFVYRQALSVAISGYTVTGANSTNVVMAHKDIDDSEIVQKAAINLLQPGAISSAGVVVTPSLVRLTRNGSSVVVDLTLSASGPLIATNLSLNVGTLLVGLQLVQAQNLAAWADLPVIMPGQSMPVSLTFPAPPSGTSARLLTGGIYNNFLFAGSFRVTIP